MYEREKGKKCEEPLFKNEKEFSKTGSMTVQERQTYDGSRVDWN
jgi:hypothetical protein